MAVAAVSGRWTSKENPGLHVDADARQPTADYVCGSCGADREARGTPAVQALVSEYLTHRKSHDEAAAR